MDRYSPCRETKVHLALQALQDRLDNLLRGHLVRAEALDLQVPLELRDFPVERLAQLVRLGQ